MSEKRSSKELKTLVSNSQGKTFGRRVVAGFSVGVKTLGVVAAVAASVTTVAATSVVLTGCGSNESQHISWLGCNSTTVEKYVGFGVLIVLIAALIVVISRTNKSNKTYWSKTSKAIGVLDDSHRLLLVGVMSSTTLELSRKNTKREVAVAIDETGISIFDCFGGYDENSNFKQMAKIKKENIEKVTLTRDEINKKLFLLNVSVNNPIEELQTKNKKDFHFALSVYDSSVLFSDIKSVINNFSK